MLDAEIFQSSSWEELIVSSSCADMSKNENSYYTRRRYKPTMARVRHMRRYRLKNTIKEKFRSKKAQGSVLFDTTLCDDCGRDQTSLPLLQSESNASWNFIFDTIPSEVIQTIRTKNVNDDISDITPSSQEEEASCQSSSNNSMSPQIVMILGMKFLVHDASKN
jgi:hypothetical protein